MKYIYGLCYGFYCAIFFVSYVLCHWSGVGCDDVQASERFNSPCVVNGQNNDTNTLPRLVYLETKMNCALTQAFKLNFKLSPSFRTTAPLSCVLFFSAHHEANYIHIVIYKSLTKWPWADMLPIKVWNEAPP